MDLLYSSLLLKEVFLQLCLLLSQHAVYFFRCQWSGKQLLKVLPSSCLKFGFRSYLKDLLHPSWISDLGLAFKVGHGKLSCTCKWSNGVKVSLNSMGFRDYTFNHWQPSFKYKAELFLSEALSDF